MEEEQENNQEIFVEIPQPKKIKVDKSKIHFRGIFALEDIESEELIERCPIVTLSNRIRYHNDPQLYNYLYTKKCSCEECKKHGLLFLMLLGYGMLYNHQDDPNTIWNFRYNESVAEVIASRPIKKGEEIFVSYGDDYFKNRKKTSLNDKTHSEQIIIKEDPNMPIEWRKWIKENLNQGVETKTIKEILVSNNFDICLIENVLGENE